LKIRIISVGKIREPFYQAGIQEYVKRLTPYSNVELVTGFEEKAPARPGDQDIIQVKQKEGQRILQQIAPGEYLVLCDVQGQAGSSTELAARVGQWMLSGKSRINIVVGGAYGLDRGVIEAAHERISLSRLTFPHQMAVLILVEQLYRTFKILRGEPYHH
jgi:23S rRNA (pseudouridine1915-N3)-methyltransferase